MKNNKRGISPLIATVLIIGFTIVLGALVITWGTKFFQTTVKDTEKASTFTLSCTSLDFDGTAVSGSDELVTVTLNNKNDQSIEGFYFVAKGGPTTGTDTYSSDENTINSGVGKTMTPTGNGALLSAFTTAQNYALASVTTGRDKLDIRPIIKDTGGKNKVCTNELTMDIIPA